MTKTEFLLLSKNKNNQGIKTIKKGAKGPWQQLSYLRFLKPATPKRTEQLHVLEYSQFSQRSRFGSTEPSSWASVAANQRQIWVPAGSGIPQTFAAAAPDWLILVPNSVAPSTRIETFGWIEYISGDVSQNSEITCWPSAGLKNVSFRDFFSFELTCFVKQNRKGKKRSYHQEKTEEINLRTSVQSIFSL